MSWTPSFPTSPIDFNTQDHELNTIDHYDILDADANDSTQMVAPIATVPAGTHQLAGLSSLTNCGSRNLYVKAQGINSVLNRISVPASYQGPGCIGRIGTSATAISWGSQPLGTSTTAYTVTVNNTGPVPLRILKIAVAGDFRIASNTCPANLPVNGTCRIGVYFRPTRLGARTGGIAIVDNAPHGPHVIGLSGTGTR